jgi:peptidoglycan/LPS O-acetylase OafA/YrhL
MNRSIPSLDGLRAVAVGLVLICHFGNDYGFDDVFNSGDLGVRIFFVISGFLITSLLLREIDFAGRLDLPRFYLRRTLRIFPAFYVYIAVMLALGALGVAQINIASAIPALTYTSNYWVVPGSSYVTSHTWSLAIEEQFYIVWPGMLLIAGRRGAYWILLAIVLLSPVARAIIYLHHGGPNPALSATHFNLDHIGMGCLLAFGRTRLHSIVGYSRFLGSRIFVAVPLFIVWATCQQDHPSIHRTLLLFLINVSIALCIDRAITYPFTVVGRVLNCRPLAFVGVISYSMYLWQQPFTHLRLTSSFSLPEQLTLLKNPVIGVMCILGCSLFSYFLIERPILNVRNGLERRRKLVPQVPR